MTAAPNRPWRAALPELADENAWHTTRFRLAVSMEIRRQDAHAAGDRAAVRAVLADLGELLDFVLDGPTGPEITEEPRALLAAAGETARYVRQVAGEAGNPGALWDRWSLYSAALHTAQNTGPTLADVVELRPGRAS